MSATAFQFGAFQTDAFQICVQTLWSAVDTDAGGSTVWARVNNAQTNTWTQLDSSAAAGWTQLDNTAGSC
jgi:hypothetical protein